MPGVYEVMQRSFEKQRENEMGIRSHLERRDAAGSGRPGNELLEETCWLCHSCHVCLLKISLPVLSR